MTDKTNDTDLRDDLASAFEAAEAPVEAPEPIAAPETVEPVEAAPEPQGEAQEPVEAKDGRVRDPKGRYAKVTDTKEPVKAPLDPAKSEAPTIPEAKAPPTPEFKPPQSWKPSGREAWATVPPAAKAEIVRRERETMQALQDSSEARQFRSQFQQHIVQPYEPIFRSMGMDPLTGTSVAVQSYAQLAGGPMPTKVAIIADAIKRFGVDVQALDAALSGQAAPQPQQSQPQQFMDPRVDQLLAQMTQARQAKEAARAEHARAAISEVESLEFFNDVRDDMADIIEAADKRGVAMSLKDAYNRAIWANPHVAEVIQQRQAARSAANPQGSTQRARAAASSVRGTPVSPAGGPQPEDLRGQLEAAWERMQGSR